MMTTVQQAYEARLAREDLRPDEAQRAVVAAFDRIRQATMSAPARSGWFSRKRTPLRGLYLWGGVGRGKSMLMDLFVQSLEVPARRVHFHAFMQEIHAAIHEARKTGVDDAIAPVAADVARDIRVLALDEMQISDITDAMIVGRLFEALFGADVAIVTTSNRAPGDLYKNGLNRALFLPFIELIADRMDILELKGGADYRQDRLTGNTVYFTPITPDARRTVESIWQDLSGGKGAPLMLEVNGREVEIPLFCNGVARATFFDLCARPLGAADYLALAEAARVLILEDIPQLGRSNFNEAKRFVTLIDALYEARVRLIATAAAQPEMLYLEGEGSFEFERTASRLREMQALDWAE